MIDVVGQILKKHGVNLVVVFPLLVGEVGIKDLGLHQVTILALLVGQVSIKPGDRPCRSNMKKKNLV